jgi:DNA replication and repair protein RecF
MSISIFELQIERFRNINKTIIHPGSGFNFFYGENGAGKTSVLEAIYHLGSGRSFRANQSQLLIQKEMQSFFLFAQVQQKPDNKIPMGVERFQDGRKTIRMEGENIASLSLLAQQLPLLFLGPESHRFFHDGPRLRRQTLDWGVFHVEHCFHSRWKLCETILKQRNSLLKIKAPYRDVLVWDIEFINAAEQLDQMRSQYVSALQPIVDGVLHDLLGMAELALIYERGWSFSQELSTVLKKNHDRDMLLGYTQSGPHRADLQLVYKGAPAQTYLSQGQQKLAAYALYLAQAMLLERLTGKKPVCLIDDLSSELDSGKRRAVLKVLTSLQTQVFITSTSYDDLELGDESFQLFHVKHGEVHNS